MSYEYTTSNAYIAYPFENSRHLTSDQESFSYDNKFPLGGFVDANVSLPFGFDTFLFTGVAKTGGVVTFHFRAEGPAVTRIVSIETDLADLPGVGGVIDGEDQAVYVRLLQGPSLVPFLLGSFSPQSFHDLLFSPATVSQRTPRLLGVVVDIGGVDHILSGAIALYEGFNVSFTDDFTINLSPGAGAGLYNACNDSEPISYITAIAGQTPDEDGNVTIEPDDCHIILAGANKITLQNICKPPCTCEGYANIAVAQTSMLNHMSAANDMISGHAVPDMNIRAGGLAAEVNNDIRYFNKILKSSYRWLKVSMSANANDSRAVVVTTISNRGVSAISCNVRVMYSREVERSALKSSANSGVRDDVAYSQETDASGDVDYQVISRPELAQAVIRKDNSSSPVTSVTADITLQPGEIVQMLDVLLTEPGDEAGSAVCTITWLDGDEVFNRVGSVEW